MSIEQNDQCGWICPVCKHICHSYDIVCPSCAEKKKTYLCDPEKNTECKKTSCQTLCFEATDPRYRKENEQ